MADELAHYQKQLAEAVLSGQPIRINMPRSWQGANPVEVGAWHIIAQAVGRSPKTIVFPNDEIAAKAMARAKEIVAERFPHLALLDTSDDNETDA